MKTLLCKRCGKPVKVNKKNYKIFEGMHYLCFHLEYEHEGFDPDEMCSDPGCFHRYLFGQGNLLKGSGLDKYTIRDDFVVNVIELSKALTLISKLKNSKKSKTECESLVKQIEKIVSTQHKRNAKIVTGLTPMKTDHIVKRVEPQ